MKLCNEFSAAAQASFAGLDVAARDADVRRSVAVVPGGFVKKQNNGRGYWYYQQKQPDGKVQQIFVGPDDEGIRALVERHGAADVAEGKSALQKLARAAIELGCPEIPLKHGRVIGRLLDHGFFKAGGLLVGTHAFLAYQNMFGIRWDAGAFTVDPDFAHAGKNVSLAIAANVEVDTAKAVDSLEMGFIPMMSGTTHKKPDEPDFDLDFLTTFGRGGDTPLFVPALNLALQPLKFMEFSLEAPMKTTLLYRNGPLVVNVPRPERDVFHKLIVYGERPQAQRTKANKDLTQAACLLDYLLENDGDLVKESWDDAMGRGPGWNQRLREGLESLKEKFPEQGFGERLGG
ncbi:MAG: hypothetical protein RLZZ573_1453 [Pseudomonadota bacterium]